MKKLSIDIETYSDVDLTKTGVYRYVEAPDFTILLFAYSVDGGPVTVCDFAQGEQLVSLVPFVHVCFLSGSLILSYCTILPRQKHEAFMNPKELF